MNSDAIDRSRLPETSATGGRRLRALIALSKHCCLVAAAIAIAPVCAHAQNAQPPMSMPLAVKTMDPSAAYYNSGPILSWLNMVSATQAAQPSWMTSS